MKKFNGLFPRTNGQILIHLVSDAWILALDLKKKRLYLKMILKYSTMDLLKWFYRFGRHGCVRAQFQLEEGRVKEVPLGYVNPNVQPMSRYFQ